jgi:hypothetical protein
LILRGARACCAAPRAGSRPSARRPAIRAPSVSLRRQVYRQRRERPGRLHTLVPVGRRSRRLGTGGRLRLGVPLHGQAAGVPARARRRRGGALRRHLLQGALPLPMCCGS